MLRIQLGRYVVKRALNSVVCVNWDAGYYPEWDENHPVHFVGHSVGAQVVRVLQQMLADKNYYNFGLDHFNMSRKNMGLWGLVYCLMGNAGPFASGDWILPDLTIQGSIRLNHHTHISKHILLQLCYQAYLEVDGCHSSFMDAWNSPLAFLQSLADEPVAPSSTCFSPV
ncbi:glutathione S-transferase omega 2 [Spatholobus suberectus]|nr:glutathione S-transferase omega 2 [Spatholobus suberectus]